MARRVKLVAGEHRFDLEVAAENDGHRVVSREPGFEAQVVSVESAPLSVMTADGTFEALVSREDDGWWVTIEGERFRFDSGESPAEGRTRGASARAEVKAPMPGKVVALLAAPGDAVVAGQGVLLFEAMKMQNEIRSPQDGILSEIHVAEGDAIEARDRLFLVLGETATK